MFRKLVASSECRSSVQAHLGSNAYKVIGVVWDDRLLVMLHAFLPVVPFIASYKADLRDIAL